MTCVFPGRYVHEQQQQQVAAVLAGETPKPFFLFISFIEPHHQNRTDDYPATTHAILPLLVAM